MVEYFASAWPKFERGRIRKFERSGAVRGSRVSSSSHRTRTDSETTQGQKAFGRATVPGEEKGGGGRVKCAAAISLQFYQAERQEC